MMKAAISVSIGFLIIMVISALVMIFMMGCLSSLFPQLTQISKYATAQAQQQMMNEFAKGGEKVLATIPTQQTFAPGTLVPFKIGIRKTADVDNDNYFTVCVGKSTGTSCTSASASKDLVQPDQKVNIKFMLPGPQKINERGQIALSEGRMQIGSDVQPGLYGFRIYSCAHEVSTTGLSSLACTGLLQSYSTYDFIIEIK